MNIKEIFRIVFINMLENKFRLLLTALGIIVGTVTIILVIAIGKGGEKEAAKQYSNLSADTIYINLDYMAVNSKTKIEDIEKLSEDLIEKIMEESTTLMGIYLRASTFSQVSYNRQEVSANIVGVTENYSAISNIEIDSGTDFSQYDYEDAERVAVIGSKTAEKLFSGEDAVGKYIKIGQSRYKVIGTIKRSEDGLQGVDTDSSIFIPYSTMENEKLLGDSTVTQAVGKAFDIKDVAKAKKEIISTMNYYMDDGGYYTVSDAGTRIEAATASARTMKTLLVSVAFIVFVVGGIGIMNVMFVTVKERTKEIGILKALGAKEKDILLLFLTEAFSIGVFSGITGVLLSLPAAAVMRFTDIPIYQTYFGKLSAFVFAAATSTIFGFYPAFKASKLMPVEALNDE